MSGTLVEFYRGQGRGTFATVRDAGAVPREGDLVNIRGMTYRVTRVTWAVDHSAEFNPTLRANIDIEEAP